MWRLTSRVLLAALLLTCTAQAAANRTVNVGVLLMTNSTFPVDLPRIGPAIDMGIEEVYRRYGIVLRKHVANYDVWCYKARYSALGNLSRLYYEENVTAFIGPGCSYAVQSAGRIAEYLRVPMVTGLGDLALRNPEEKDMLETTVILSYNIKKLSVSVQALLNAYKWKHISIIYDEDEVFYKVAGPSMVDDFEAAEDFPHPHPVPFRRFHAWDPSTTLVEAAAHARVFIVLVNAAEFRRLMYHAYHRGMAAGDYAFLVVQLAEIAWWGSYRNFLVGDELDVAQKVSYESVLLLALLNPAINNTAFQAEFKSRALADYGHSMEHETVHNFISSFYEAVLYLGAAYNKSFEESGGNIDDGYDVARSFFGSVFQGLGGMVAVDDTGTRIADFEVLDLVDADTQTFQRVGLFLGATLDYVPVPGTQVRWLAGVPMDVPECGFTGDLCIEERMSAQVIGGVIAGCIVAILLVIIVLQNIYSRRKANSDMRWKIPWAEVDLKKRNCSLASGFSKSKINIVLQADMVDETNPAYGTTATYNGTTVYVRQYDFTSVNLGERNVQELRRLYNIRHNNIETFVGACVENGRFLVLSEVSPRGRLQDIIANEGIELDWTFRHSLINDVVQGMKYLHSSDIRVHGDLRSGNCVVDSRFMLKIRGFGPKFLIDAERRQADQRTLNYGKMLWTAPEILRQAGAGAGNQPGVDAGTQAGDVYSFAIILQEIIAWGEPFENCYDDSNAIVDRIISGERPPFRPQANEYDCPKELHSVMVTCWDEDPDQRPSFDSIDSTLRKVFKMRGSNIMDNLMRRMEQYANNLESLVEERTKAYMDEKRKAETLLYRMLPVSVAKQLQSGSKVEPETYDDVTIYFSDIVGFTTLAGQSSPMQVVDLLNDLYTTFDAIIDNFLVYKVETIGDAYMCASGLPIRIGDRHAQEIANMALSVRQSVLNFKIRHLPHEALRIRIGLHSGTAVAGVVGLTMPRYCLFGDTVNTASRMESNGEAMKIHISEPTKCLLKTFEGYTTEIRGEIDVKGKGKMKTYWLVAGPDVGSDGQSSTFIQSHSHVNRTEEEKLADRTINPGPISGEHGNDMLQHPQQRENNTNINQSHKRELRKSLSHPQFSVVPNMESSRPVSQHSHKSTN